MLFVRGGLWTSLLHTLGLAAAPAATTHPLKTTVDFARSHRIVEGRRMGGSHLGLCGA